LQYSSEATLFALHRRSWSLNYSVPVPIENCSDHLSKWKKKYMLEFIFKRLVKVTPVCLLLQLRLVQNEVSFHFNVFPIQSCSALLVKKAGAFETRIRVHMHLYFE
jgi:hypothetical protein